MLVRDPKQRYTIEQIRKHDWLRMDPSIQLTLNMNCDLNSETDSEPDDLEDDERVYNERALRLMENLRIDIPKTKKVNIHYLYNFSLPKKGGIDKRLLHIRDGIFHDQDLVI